MNARGVQVRRPQTPEDFFTSESFILGVLLLAATILAYYPVHAHPFVNFDDPAYVVDNPHIASGWDTETISWAFTTFYQFNWHPLTWLSHALDRKLFGLEPAGPHVMNMLFHVANVLLLYLVLLRATGYAGRSAMVAGLFALHPINVESVAWIAERKNLLSMFFFLMGLGAYVWYAASPMEEALLRPNALRGRRHAEPKPSIPRYAVMTVFFALGLMCKPQIVTFPFILLLWDYWPLGRLGHSNAEIVPGTLLDPVVPTRSFGWLVKEKLPLFAICAASAAVTVAAQQAGGAVVSLEKYPMSVRMTNAIVSYVRYLGKAVWPAHLAIIYPHPWHPLPLWQVVPSLLALVAITALVIVARERRYLLVGWFWFLGSLVPMIGLVHVGNQAMADRYAYLPFIGLFLMVCWTVSELADRLRIPVLPMRTAAALILLALMLAADHQLGYWANNVDLWEHTLAVTDGNYIAHDNLAQILMDKGDVDGALRHRDAALAIYPDDPNSLLALAVYDHQHGMFQEAIARYQHMERITPPGPAHAALLSKEGLVYFDMQDSADAQAEFRKAVAMDPDNVRGWLGLGVMADRSGDLKTAIENYRHANEIRPMKITYLLLAKALDATGDISGAELAREQAKLLSGGDTTTQTFSGGLLQK